MNPVATIRNDYRAWVALGEGGFDHGPIGWLKTSVLRVLASRDVFRTRSFTGQPSPEVAALPVRSTPRPKIAPHPVPHREIGEDCAPAMLIALDQMIEAAHARYPQSTQMGTSEYERHVDALFVADAVSRGESRNGEIVHVHRPQGTLHVHCAPADAKVVIERGWGELHPLAVHGIGLPRTYLLLYAPRSDEDLRAIGIVVDAAIAWASR